MLLMSYIKQVTVLALLLALCSGQDVCTDLKSDLLASKESTFSDKSSLIARYINVDNGSDIEECLNYNNISHPLPCKTLHYALNGEIDGNISNSDTIFHLGPGSHSLTRNTGIISSDRVVMVGEGAGVTFLNCGGFLNTDGVCLFLNLQIRDSNFVYLSGLTFTRCGPITSDLYIAFSDNIFIEDCVFT